MKVENTLDEHKEQKELLDPFSVDRIYTPEHAPCTLKHKFQDKLHEFKDR